MKKTACKALLSLLCAVVLLIGMVPATVYAEMGCDFPWTKEQTLLEKIVERDGLLDGVWFPWFNAGGSGHNLTGNEVMAKYYDPVNARVEMDYYGADKIYQEIYNLKAMGFNMMAYGGSIYGEGVIYDAYGDVLGIKEEYLTNARRLLNMCREIGMPVMWNIYFHCSSAPHYYGMQGWNIMCRMLGDRTVADHYAERFVKPLCQMLAEYPDVVALVSIADEPENEINDVQMGNHFADSIRTMYGVNRDDMIYFMKGINDMCKKVLPNVPRTVASNAENKSIYSGFGLDLMGHNRYDTNANVSDVENFYTDADIILTEYNIGGDASHLTDAEFAAQLKKFRDNFITKGYKGGFQWCWIPNATDAAYYMLSKGAKSHTDFKETVALTRYIIDDYRAAYQGKKIAFDTPVLYANEGTGLVEWIPSRKATKVTIERSDDGGKTWKAILKDADCAPLITKGKGKYMDNDASKPKSGFCYRVTMTDGKNKATSAPNNKAGSDKAYKVTYKTPTIDYPTATDKVAPIFNKKTEPEKARLTSFAVAQNRPAKESANLIKNGSFESTSGAQWNTSDFLKHAKVVNDSTAPEGSKSLFFDTSSSEAGWYKFTVAVKPDTDYTFSTWVKGDYLGEDNEGHASVGVWDPVLGGFMVYLEFYRDSARGSRLNQQIYPTAWDDEWHLRAVQFHTKPDETEITIALYGVGSKMWLDGMALYTVDQGITYRSDNYNARLDYRYYVETPTCDPAKSLTQNVRMDDTKNTFWQSGDGWRNGFLSFADNKYEYGRSLKYKAGSAVGNYYIKWVDVKPNTEYIFSVNMKILKSGEGKLALVEDKYYPNVTATMALQFDSESFGNEWFRYNIRFNTKGYSRIGIAVCDLGGEALLDNIRLFKTSDSKDVTDPYKDKTGNTVAPPTATVRPSVSTGTTEGDGITDVTTLPSDVVTDPTEGETAPSAPADAPADSKDVETDKDKGGAPWLVIGIAGGAALLVAGGVVLLLLLRKKKATPPTE